MLAIAVIALVISVLSAALAVWAAISSHRVAIATDRLAAIEAERRHEERASAKRAAAVSRAADLRIRWASDDLTIANTGLAPAQRITIEPVGALDDRALPQLLDPGAQPIDALAPDETVTLRLPHSKELAAHMECLLQWQDGEGAHEERRRLRRS